MSADSSGGGDRGKPRSARPSKPTPVRALEDAPPTRNEGPAPPPERMTFQVGETSWTAEAVGHAEGAGGTHILLVRFVPGGEIADAGGDVTKGAGESLEGAREAWVVGARLEALPHARLAEVLARAGPWKGSETTAPFFADEGGRRGR